MASEVLDSPNPDITQPATPITPTKYKRGRINYVLAATLLTKGVTLEEAAKHAGAKNGNTLRIGLIQNGITQKQIRALPDDPNCNSSVVIQAANKASEILKNRMGELLDTHTAQLQLVKAKPNLQHIAKVGAALEPLARVAKIVHGWGDETKSGLIALGVVEQVDTQANQVLDVSSSVSETTTGSVPIPATDSSTPQG